MRTTTMTNKYKRLKKLVSLERMDEFRMNCEKKNWKNKTKST